MSAWAVNSDPVAKLVQFPPSSAASTHPPHRMTTLFPTAIINFQGLVQSTQSHWKIRLEFSPPWLQLQVSHLFRETDSTNIPKPKVPTNDQVMLLEQFLIPLFPVFFCICGVNEQNH